MLIFVSFVYIVDVILSRDFPERLFFLVIVLGVSLKMGEMPNPSFTDVAWIHPEVVGSVAPGSFLEPLISGGQGGFLGEVWNLVAVHGVWLWHWMPER